MKAFTTLTSIVAPLDRANVDTDAIIPKQFLKSIRRTGFGVYLFDEWRYLDQGQPDMDCTNRPINKDFVLNKSQYQGAQILLTRENFGCGSSREHAPWALEDYGFRAIIAPSFADIFYNNCFKNGILPIALDAEIVDFLFKEVTEGYTTDSDYIPEPISMTLNGEEVMVTMGETRVIGWNYSFTIDLAAQTITTTGGKIIPFNVDENRKFRLLNGLDDIGLTLQHADKIHAYETERAKRAPWLFR